MKKVCTYMQNGFLGNCSQAWGFFGNKKRDFRNFKEFCFVM